MEEARRRRIAQNEARFREINEGLVQDVRSLALGEEVVAFVCECGREDCSLPLQLTAGQYEHVRADPTHFAVRAGHDLPEVERVIERFESHWVIEKHLLPGKAIVEEADPRR